MAFLSALPLSFPLSTFPSSQARAVLPQLPLGKENFHPDPVCIRAPWLEGACGAPGGPAGAAGLSSGSCKELGCGAGSPPGGYSRASTGGEIS